MSERGTFITSEFNCDTCREAFRPHVEGHQFGGWLIGSEIPHTRAFGGRIVGHWGGEEVFDFRTRIGPCLSDLLCDGHRIRVVVLADSGPNVIFTLEKNKEMIETPG